MGMMEELQERIDTSSPALVYRAIEPTYGWDTVVGYIQHCADNEAGEPIGIMEYKLPLADQIDSVSPVKEYLNENLKVEVVGVDMYATLTTKNDLKYKSNNDILLYNVIGFSELNVLGEERTAEPGDLIFIPKDTEYTFKPLMARSYLVFSLAKGESIDDNEAL